MIAPHTNVSFIIHVTCHVMPSWNDHLLILLHWVHSLLLMYVPVGINWTSGSLLMAFYSLLCVFCVGGADYLLWIFCGFEF